MISVGKSDFYDSYIKKKILDFFPNSFMLENNISLNLLDKINYRDKNIKIEKLRLLKNERINIKKKINEKDFQNILNLYYKKISKKIIEDDKTYFLSEKLGFIIKHKFERKPKKSKNGVIVTSINWGESNKKRKELISEGKLPYEAIKNENGEIIGDNGGIKWQIYYTHSDIYGMIWLKNKILNPEDNRKFIYFLKNIKKCRYKNTFHNKKLISKTTKNLENDL